jgi:hypothetical protein
MSRSLKLQQSTASKKAYEESHAKFAKASPSTASGATQTSYKSNPVYRSSTVYHVYGYDDVYARRHRIYSGWSAPSYIYYGYPSYGSWDSTFLWWALFHDNSFGYHHYYDPGYQQWLDEARKQAATNADLRAQLARQEAQIAAMQQTNAVRDANYVPPSLGNDAVVALSDEAIGTLPVEQKKGHPVLWTMVILAGLGSVYYLFFIKKWNVKRR